MPSGLHEFAHLLLLGGVTITGVAQSVPFITKQPVGQSVSIGANASFSVTASGVPAPAFQWIHDGENVFGATNRTLQLSKVKLTDRGSYRVEVSNGFGTITSAAAGLDVDPAFTEITLPLFNIAGGSSGASWIDVDGDSTLDLLIVGKGGGGTTLLTNRGDGTFGKPLNSGLTSSGLGGGSFGDFNNDGAPDVFVGGANGIYRNLTAGKFALLTPGLGVSGAYCSAWADYDNDGFLDLFCGNYYTGGLNFLFRNNGNSSFTKVSDLPPAQDRSYSQGIAWADYDNDGRPDLFISNTSGQKCLLYKNQGLSGFTKITNSPVTTVAGNFSCGTWGDYDNDGNLDLFLCGYKQRRLLFHNEGNGAFTQALAAGFTAADAGEDQSASWIDYDNDGHLDLFICSGGLTYGLNDTLYRNNADGTFTRHSRGSLVNDQGEGAGAAWGDFDRNGFPDVFITNFQNTGARSNYLYQNNGNINAWLNVRLIGRISNRSGIGAKIRVTATIEGKTRQQVREISGGGAYVSQNSPEAMFGFGSATIIDLLRIEWPSGIVQEFRGLEPRQFLNINEPSRITDPNLAAGELSFRAQGYDAETTLQVSTDLKEWLSPTNSIPADGVYREQIMSAGGSRFFRMVNANTFQTSTSPAPLLRNLNAR